MKFYHQLLADTEQERQILQQNNNIQLALAGQISLDKYVGYLSQAYHHVKNTVPLLMAVGARLPDSHEWLREAVAEYIEDELGHQEWVLNDIAACGYDKELVRHSTAHTSTELMVSYAWDMVNRVNPIGFFGMVLVLEGTSIAMADHAAASVKQSLSLPSKAFSYLISHGSIDQEHIKFFEGLMDKITDPKEQAIITHTAKIFYGLYGAIFTAIDDLEPAMNDWKLKREA